MISGRGFIHFRLDVLIEPFLRCFSSSQASRIQYRANRCSGSLQRYVSWRVSSSFQPCFCRKSIMSAWECLSKVSFIGLVFFQASAQETSYGCDSLPVTHVTHSRSTRRRHPRLLSATIDPTLSAPSGNQAALVACFHSDSYK